MLVGHAEYKVFHLFNYFYNVHHPLVEKQNLYLAVVRGRMVALKCKHLETFFPMNCRCQSLCLLLAKHINKWVSQVVMVE